MDADSKFEFQMPKKDKTGTVPKNEIKKRLLNRSQPICITSQLKKSKKQKQPKQ